MQPYGSFDAPEPAASGPATPTEIREPRRTRVVLFLTVSVAALAGLSWITRGSPAMLALNKLGASAPDNDSGPGTDSDPDSGSDSAPGTGSDTTPNSPNILLLMLDQARPDAFSVYGTNPVAYTPNIDTIATQGVRFTNAYSSTPICTPARQALLTGKKPWSHGMRGYANNIVPSTFIESWVTLPKLLRDHGFFTASIGKNHFGYNASTLKWLNHGFREQMLYEGALVTDPSDKSDFVLLDNYGIFFNESCPNCDPMATKPVEDYNAWWGSPYTYDNQYHPTSWTGRIAVDWIDNWDVNNQNEDHFFLKVSFQRPHSPYDPPVEWWDHMVAQIDAIPEPYTSVNDWDHAYGVHSELCNMSKSDTYCGNPGLPKVLESRAAYLGSLAFVDEQVGNIWQALKNAELLESTFIMLVADHGDSLGDHNLWRKGYFTEQVAGIPFYVRWPQSMDGLVAINRNSTIDNVVELRDVLPTLAEVASIVFTDEQAREVDGHSVLRLMQKDDNNWRPYIDLEFAECSFNETMNWNALTDGKTVKYVHNLYTGNELLFNLTADPNELNDLSDHPAYTPTLNLWRSRLIAQFNEETRGTTFMSHEGGLQTLHKTRLKCANTKLLANYPCYPDFCSTH